MSTKAPTKPQLAAMSDQKVNAMIYADKTHRHHYVVEGLQRMAKARPGSFFALVREEMNGDHPKASTKAHRKPASYEGKIWRFDKELAEDDDFPGALQTLLETVFEYWVGDLQKDPEEVEAFIESLIEQGLAYDELTPGQQKLLGMARRYHMIWMRKMERTVADTPF